MSLKTKLINRSSAVVKLGFVLFSWIFINVCTFENYGGKRKYQYNEEDFFI